MGALVAARVLQAAGGAMIIPSTLGLILPAFPAEKRAVAVGIWSAVGGVAAALGPPIGGVLVEADWRWIFIVNVPVGIAAIVAGRAFLPEIRESVRAPRPDGVGALLLAASIALLTAAIVEGPDWGWADPRVIGGFAGAALGLALFVWRSARHRAPVIELPLLRVRSVAVANGAAMVFFAGFAAMLLAAVLFLTEVWGYSIVRAGLAIAPGPLLAALTAVPAGRLAARTGPRLPAIAGGLVFAAGFAWPLSFVGADAGLRERLAPGLPARRDRRGPGPAEPADGRDAPLAAGSVRDRHRGVRDVEADRIGDRRGDLRRDRGQRQRPGAAGRAAGRVVVHPRHGPGRRRARHGPPGELRRPDRRQARPHRRPGAECHLSRS